MSRRSWSVGALLALLVVSGCAGIPSSGPVVQVPDDGDLGQSAVRYSPARPLPGASPEQIVRGYLDAMLAFPASSRTASAFLTPEAAQEWRASSQFRIYSNPEVTGSREPAARSDPRTQPQGDVTVRLGFTEDAVLDRQGRYARSAAPAAITYTLQQVQGEWRITDPQDGLLINQKFFGDYFRPFNLYFFDRPGRRLVPDPIHLVVGDQLATSLVSGLAGGPAKADEESSRSYVPPRSALRPSVPISDEGVADVEFTDDFGDLSSTSRDHLSAQLVWTLRQVPGVEAVQAVGGSTVLTAGGDEAQPVQAWGGYGPSTARGRAYGVVGNRVVEIDDGEIAPVSGSWGENARGAELVAVSEAGVAGVLAGRDRVRVTTRQGDAAQTIRGSGLIGPDWDSDGSVWLVDQVSTGTRVRLADVDAVRSIDVGALADLDVLTFKISPDGTRYAVTTPDSGGALYVGSILRDVKNQVYGLGAPERVFTEADAPRSASWSSPTELSFLAESPSGVQVYQAAIDGSKTTSEVSRSGALLPDVAAETLAIGQGSSPVLYVTDGEGQLWSLPSGGSWQRIDTGGVTGLSYGR